MWFLSIHCSMSTLRLLTPPRLTLLMNSLNRSYSICKSSLVILGFVALPTLALAHPGHFRSDGGAVDSFAAGFLHPFSGVDHLILAIAAGWLAFSLGSRKAILPVGAFLAALAAGAVAGQGVTGGAGLEIALACTLIGAGAVFLAGKVPQNGLFLAALVVAGFIHGFAHGSESIPSVAFGLSVIGFVSGTAFFLILGGFFHGVIKRIPAPVVVSRLAGVTLLTVGSLGLVQAL